jgi:SAM-dependent methyltransferase
MIFERPTACIYPFALSGGGSLLDSTLTHPSARFRRILDANFYAPNSSVAYRFSDPAPAKPAKRAPALTLSDTDIRTAIAQHAPLRSLLPAVVRQFAADLRQQGAAFFNENGIARGAYARLSAQDLRDINRRQQWAAWRAIPRSLSGVVENKPLSVIDLCCGVGDSTEVLAHFLPRGSQILGLDFQTLFVDAAARRDYKHRSGAAASTRFSVQSILEPFRDVNGAAVPMESVDLVHAIGAFSVNFTPQQTLLSVVHAWRVLKTHGVLILDLKKSGAEREEILKGIRHAGFAHIHSAKSCTLDRSRQECFRKM